MYVTPAFLAELYPIIDGFQLYPIMDACRHTSDNLQHFTAWK